MLGKAHIDRHSVVLQAKRSPASDVHDHDTHGSFSGNRVNIVKRNIADTAIELGRVAFFILMMLLCDSESGGSSNGGDY